MEKYTSSKWELEDGTSFSATSYKPNDKIEFPSSKTIDIEYILANTRYPTSGSVLDVWFNIKFGSFWIAMEVPPAYRNLTAAANVILGDPDTKEIASRMVTIKHLVLRMGLEDSSWPEVLSFDPFIYLGSLKGITAFTISGFVFLAATICGCFLMYFAVLLLDDKKEDLPDNLLVFVDQDDYHNSGFEDWILVATVVQSLLFFLLVVSDFFLGLSGSIFFGIYH
jgi:hypothetical protein